MNTIKRREMADILKISSGHFSDILNGNAEVGKATAKKFGELTGLPWVNFLIMPPEQIETAIKSAMGNRADGKA